MTANAPQRVVVATRNPGKLREIAGILSEFRLEFVDEASLGVPPAEETACTFVENALIKARNAARHTGLPAIADDSGLVVDALEGRPGVHSARFAGPGAGDRENLELLLRELAARGLHRPVARFVCAMVYLSGERDPVPVIAQASWEGVIVSEPRGSNGFGYDPVFFLPDRDCTSAELPPDEKNRLSHRGQALRLLCGELRVRAGALFPS
jgi:XTP/dITP diphosphohydrolase